MYIHPLWTKKEPMVQSIQEQRRKSAPATSVRTRLRTVSPREQNPTLSHWPGNKFYSTSTYNQMQTTYITEGNLSQKNCLKTLRFAASVWHLSHKFGAARFFILVFSIIASLLSTAPEKKTMTVASRAGSLTPHCGQPSPFRSLETRIQRHVQRGCVLYRLSL